MKTSKKPIVKSYFIALIILFVGLSSLYSMNKFHENSAVNIEMNDFVRELDHLIEEFLLLIETDSLEEYNELKSEIEFRITDSDILYRRVRPVIEKFDQGEAFTENLKNFKEVSNDLIIIQKETIIDNNDFDEKYLSERRIRKDRRLLTAESDSINLVSIGWHLEYNSKEALFQFKDEAHIDDWFESINLFRSSVIVLDLQKEKKEALLENIDSYQLITFDLAKIILKQSEVEDEKHIKIHELREIIDEIDKNEGEISKKMNSKNSSLARNTFLIIVIFAGIGVILLIISILRSIKVMKK